MGDHEDNYSFLRKYQKLQLSITYDELTDLGFAVLGYSKLDPGVYWNNALTEQILTDSQIAQVEQQLEARKRQVTFYYEDTPRLERLSAKLESKHYEKSFEDSWLFWKGHPVSDRYFESVKEVSNAADLELFLATFDRCYQENDPQNPYGDQSHYIESARKAWQKNHETNKLEYFILYKGDQPVSVASLTNYDGIGYISNVGSLREVRGQGYGKAATLYCIDKSIKNGNTEHCLATEEGHFPNEFYQRIGFGMRFKAIGYTKAP